MTQYFFGADSYGARQEIGRLAQAESAVVRWLDKDDLADRPARGWLEQGSGGLFGRELLVIRDPAMLPKSIQNEVLTAAHGTRAKCVLWDRGAVDRRSLIYRQLAKVAREFVALSQEQLVSWLRAEAGRQGGGIERSAAGRLIERVGEDRWALKSELDRLLIEQPRVTVTDVERGVTAQVTGEIFVLLRAVATGEIRKAVRETQALLQEGKSEFYVMTMLAYQFKTLLMIRLGWEEGWRPMEIARWGKMKLFAVEKNLEIARRRPVAYWREGLTRVLAGDFAIKQGKVDSRTGLLLLVMSLAKRR